MPLAVKQGRKIGIFLKDNIPTNKGSFVEREVYVTLQGSKTGKETKVKLKINAGRRHAPIQSNSGAVTLSESGQIVETFNPEQLPEEIQEIIKEEKIIEKLDLIEEEKILDIPDIVDEVEPDPLAGTGIKPGQFSGMVDTDAIKKIAKSGGLSNLGNLGNLGNLNLNLGLGRSKDPVPAPKKKAPPSVAAVVTAAKTAAAKTAAAKKAAALVAKLSSKGVGRSAGPRNPSRKKKSGRRLVG
jgi:hypothetical protein